MSMIVMLMMLMTVTVMIHNYYKVIIMLSLIVMLMLTVRLTMVFFEKMRMNIISISYHDIITIKIMRKSIMINAMIFD